MPKYLTVSALNRYLKFKFDQDSQLQSILLKAEISNFKRHSRGHLYLTLKDNQSQISAVMFASQTKSLKFVPKDGDQIIVSGYVSIYEPYGNYQVYITKMEMDGIGDLYLAYEQLKKSLEAEGLFKEEHKKPIPTIPDTVGVITSKTGAAVRDIIHVISTRFPRTKIIIYPASVQGVFAKGEIVNQIQKANRDQLCDCLIVGRGGGSIEDLWPFNEEVVARAIYESRIPIISAVGHETDFTIADFVADRRASTPSHAAEMAVPHHQKVETFILNQAKAMTQELKHKQQKLEQRLKGIIESRLFIQPMRLIQNEVMHFNHLYDRLIQKSPKQIIQQKMMDINALKERLHRSFKRRLEQKQYHFNRLAESLELVNPLSIMTKGYALVKQDDMIKKSIKDIKSNQDVIVSMHDGDMRCQIIDMKGNKHE